MLLRHVVHLFGPIPAVGEVLVVEQWDEAIGLFHHGCYLVEESFPRILVLSQIIVRVLAVFADGKHRIDGQFLPSDTQCFSNRFVQRDVILTRDTPGHVSVGNLV